jgi:hypothetical protein
LLVCLAHLLQSVGESLADFLDFALLLLREDEVSLASDGALQDSFADQLADELANRSFLEFKLGGKAPDGN